MADVWTPTMGPGVYDFETGRFTPAAPADSAGATPALDADDFGFGPLDDDEVAAMMSGLGQADEQPAAEQPEQAEAPADEAPVDEPPAEPIDEPVDEPKVAPDVAEVRAAAEEIAMLDALAKWVGEELSARKKDHAPLLADAANIGSLTKVDLKLPDGTKIGTFNLDEPDVQIAWNDAATLAHVEKTSKHNVYEVVSPTAINHEDVIEFIRLTHPELIKREVRPAYLTLLAESLDDEGCVVSEGGELVKIAKRVPVPSEGKGRLGWTRPKGKPTGRDQLVAAWRAGTFQAQGLLAASPGPAPEAPAAE